MTGKDSEYKYSSLVASSLDEEVVFDFGLSLSAFFISFVFYSEVLTESLCVLSMIISVCSGCNTESG